jgi:single-strand DNA-binding protein
LKKGAKIYIEGQLQTRKWTNKEGQEQYSTEVVLQGFNSTLQMLDGKGGGSNSSDSGYDDGGSAFGGGSYNKPAAAKAPMQHSDLDDEIPF